MPYRHELTLEDLEIDLEDLQEFIARERELNALRKKHSYVGDLIRLLVGRESGLSRQMVLHELRRQRNRDGLPIPPSFEEAVQSSYNQYSIDSVVFRKRGLPDTEAIFYAPGGKGSGRWAVHQVRAGAWLKAQLDQPQ